MHGGDDDERSDPTGLALTLLPLVRPIRGPCDHTVEQEHVRGNALRDDRIDPAVLTCGVAHARAISPMLSVAAWLGIAWWFVLSQIRRAVATMVLMVRGLTTSSSARSASRVKSTLPMVRSPRTA